MTISFVFYIKHPLRIYLLILQLVKQIKKKTHSFTCLQKKAHCKSCENPSSELKARVTGRKKWYKNNPEYF